MFTKEKSSAVKVDMVLILNKTGGDAMPIQRPSQEDYLQAASWATRPHAPRPGNGIPPGPGWEWYVIAMLAYIADLLEKQTQSSEKN